MVTIKLSSSNYLLWKSQLLPLLESQELIGYMDGTVEIPPRFTSENSQTPNIKHVAWKHTDQRLLSLLLSSLTKEAMAEVVGLSTSCEVSVSEYARAFKALCDQLHAIGQPVDGTNKVHWFLRGFGLEFSSFSTTQMAFAHLPYFADLVPKAKSFELFQKSLEPAAPSLVAFTATNRNSAKSNHAALLPAINQLALAATNSDKDAPLADDFHAVKSSAWRVTMRTGASNGMTVMVIPLKRNSPKPSMHHVPFPKMRLRLGF
ncbi:hypothetical protein PVL29_020487 [Vitis rotundifolia]|uniref:Retrotransposon Copia-like N-terminal domain-containing protein n=1 Tax=Vitis rotundifolia TaxID=103349 RepID=A0AA38YX54_VITRO|nr:hypothetical protein PVL29_020487 [Vitis rotundifolia]